ncbi:CLUMA_CG021621, isoform A [Clunio marinus]|uniref:CLUMA_CG021621, isoform A n=1 Tax=Clunio marinus TaxID=568069 RepID=A0A1J1J7J5_9DIPT|nr:CLUMA_CG021621, isoform A [Clunio marinus]
MKEETNMKTFRNLFVNIIRKGKTQGFFIHDFILKESICDPKGLLQSYLTFYFIASSNIFLMKNIQHKPFHLEFVSLSQR